MTSYRCNISSLHVYCTSVQGAEQRSGAAWGAISAGNSPPESQLLHAQAGEASSEDGHGRQSGMSSNESRVATALFTAGEVMHLALTHDHPAHLPTFKLP